MKALLRYLQIGIGLCLVLAAATAQAWKMEAGKLTLSATSSLSQLQQHNFQQIYDTPPIVIALPTTAGSHTSSIRISNVTTTGFRMSPVEPRSNDGPHAAMTVSYIAIEAGSHALPNGEVIEAGLISTDEMQLNGKGKDGWERLSFINRFNNPVVLADIQTTRNETSPTIPRSPSHPWLTVAIDNIRNDRTNIALERSEVFDQLDKGKYEFNDLAQAENIGYVVMDSSLRGNFRASGNVLINFETLYSGNSVDGWSNGCDNINFAGSYSSTPIVVATKSTRNEKDGGWLRECSVNSSRIQLTIDEDISQDSERNHTSEDASLLIFSDSFFYDSNAPTTITTANNLMLESDSATLSTSAFTSINFKQVYELPPAVFLLEDNQNPEPSSVRIRNITTQGFEAIAVEPDSTVADASDQTTTIHYLAIAKGQFSFPDGKKIEVGPVAPPDEIINFQSKRLSGDSWFNFNFSTSFSSIPALLSQIQSMNSESGHTPGAPSRPWMTTAVRNVSNTGGELALDRAETNTGTISAAEKIAYLAMEPGVIGNFKDLSGNTIETEAQRTANNLAGTLNCYNYNFLQSYPAPPLVVGSQMTWDGGDGGWLRRCSTSASQVSLKIEEDWAQDRDNSHTTESAGFLAFSEPFQADFSLVANYQLEGPSWPHTPGDVQDSSNSGLNGQSFGDARPFPAQVCNGALLDGDRDYIEIPDNAALDISDELTVMAWIRPAVLPASDLMTIVSKDTNFEFHLDSAGRVVWWWNNSSGADRTFASNAVRVSAGSWYHVAVSYSKSAGIQKIFINGAEADRRTFANESLINNNLPMYIGTDYAYPSRDFNGSIDEVKVFKRALSQAAIQKFAAESRACSSCILGSFEISQPSFALACPDTRAEVDIIARCTDGTVKTDYSGSVNLSGPTGSQFYPAATGGSSITSLNYSPSDAGRRKAYLYFNNEQSDVKVSASDSSASISSTAATGTDFRAFGFNISRQPASFACGSSSSMRMVAYGKSDNSPGAACEVITGFNGSKTLDAWFRATTNDDAIADPVSTAVTLSGTVVSAQSNAASDNLTLNFVNGGADISIAYPDAARILDLNFRYDAPPYNNTPFSAMAASSAPFVVRPAQFSLSASAGGSPLTGNSSGSAVVHRAGEAFTLEMTAQCSDSSTATQYAPTNTSGTLMAYLQRTGPLGGTSVEGELSLSASKLLTSDTAVTPLWESANLSAGNFTNGVFSYSGAQYNEVGLIRLHIKDQNYFGEQIPETAIDIGRFIPDYFEVSVNPGSLAPFCSPTAAPAFSYIGQPIQYAALPELTIEARNRNNLLTRNYTEAGFFNLAPVDVRRFFPSEDATRPGADGLTNLALTSTKLVPASFSSASGGVIRYTFDSADSFTYTKNVNAQIAPFSSGIQVDITDVVDSDNVGSNAEPYAVIPAPIDLHFGRLRIDNAFGPEISSLAIPMQVEYWTGNTFAVNTSDSCTSYAASQLIDSESLSGGSTTPSGSGSFVSGNTPAGNEISLSAPGASNIGTVDLEYLADAWLRYDWDNNPATPDTNPTATASFGQYRGHDRIIYWRELSN